MTNNSIILFYERLGSIPPQFLRDILIIDLI